MCTVPVVFVEVFNNVLASFLIMLDMCVLPSTVWKSASGTHLTTCSSERWPWYNNSCRSKAYSLIIIFAEAPIDLPQTGHLPWYCTTDLPIVRPLIRTSIGRAFSFCHAFCTLLHPFRDWFGILPCCIVSSLLHVLCTLLLWWRVLCILRSSCVWFILNVLCTILRFEQGSCILQCSTVCPLPHTSNTQHQSELDLWWSIPQSCIVSSSHHAAYKFLPCRRCLSFAPCLTHTHLPGRHCLYIHQLNIKW